MNYWLEELSVDFEVLIFGRFCVRLRGVEVPASEFSGRLVQRLVRVLATRRGQRVERRTLAEALWPERPPADPERNLNVMVARARRALGEPSAIRTVQGGYCFDPEGKWSVDGEEFANLVASARAKACSGQPRAALERTERALELWQGDPLPEDAGEPWADDYRDLLYRLYLEALETGAQAALRSGEPAIAVNMADRAAALQPLRESANLILARALHEAGDTARALATIADLKHRLAELLGLDPSPEVGRTERAILTGATAPAQWVGSGGAGKLPFVGRDIELNRVAGWLEQPAAVVLVAGCAGMGKSRLLDELRRCCPADPITAAAFSAERDEPWALARALVRDLLSKRPEAAKLLTSRAAAALASVVPEIEPPAGTDAAADPQTRRALAFEGALGLFAGAAASGVTVIVDDLQWSDPTSVTLLGKLIDRVAGLRLVLACRTEDMEPGSPAARLASTAGIHPIILHPLGPEAIGQLIDGQALIDIVVQRCDRSPLAVAELMRSLAAAGAIVHAPDGRRVIGAPGSAEIAGRYAEQGRIRALLARLNALPDTQRLVVEAVALLGRPAPARLLASALSVGQPAVLVALEGLARTGLVQLVDAGWDIGHDLICDALTGPEDLQASPGGEPRSEQGADRHSSLGEGRKDQASTWEHKARLHLLLAGALALEGADAGEQAVHLAAGGDSIAASAAYLEAGRFSLDNFATQEAQRFANAGLALRPRLALRADLLEVRAEALVRHGMLSEARRDLQAAIPARRTGPERSLILSKLAILISGSQDYFQASELAALALTEAGADPAARARALAAGAMIQGNLSHLESAARMGREALELYRSLEDAHGVADILELQALHTFTSGHLDRAAQELGWVASLFENSGKLLRIGQPRSLRCITLCMQNRPDQALAEMNDVLQLEINLGHAEGIALAHAGRSAALIGLRRVGEANLAATLALDASRALHHKELTALALFVRGLALTMSGDLAGGEESLQECIEESAGLPMYLSMAAARLSTLKIVLGKPEEARRCLAEALAWANPFSMYEARLAQAELAAALGDHEAPALAAHALEVAQEHGHHLSIPRLSELAGMTGKTT
ncbi:MAG: BTAD domain-containing putative transcriptional regulator [Actinomycetota bacterium]